VLVARKRRSLTAKRAKAAPELLAQELGSTCLAQVGETQAPLDQSLQHKGLV